MSSASLVDGSWYYVLLALGVATGVYRTIGHIVEHVGYELEYSRQQEEHRRRRKAWHDGPIGELGRLGTASTLSEETLQQLALGPNYGTRKAATELLIDRAMQPQMLKTIITSASDTTDEIQQRQAARVLFMLAQAPWRLGRIAQHGGLEVLIACLGTNDREIARGAATALAEFVGPADADVARENMQAAADRELLQALQTQLLAGAVGEADATTLAVCVGMARQYAQRARFGVQMGALGLAGALLGVARRALADAELLQAAMEGVVRLCTCAEATGRVQQMEQLVEQGAVDVVAGCVMQADRNAASWGIGLLHELVSRGVGKTALARRTGLVRRLCRRLATSKYAYTNQLILRALWCLGSEGDAVLTELAQPSSLRRVLAVLALEDDAEARQWSVLLLGRVAALPSAHAWLVASPLPRVLRDMAERVLPGQRAVLLPEIANIIARLCHSIALAPQLAHHTVLADACRALATCDVENARLAALMALINASATSREFLRLAVTRAVRQQIVRMATDFDRELPRTYAAKALAALLAAAAVPSEMVVHRALVPFLSRVTTCLRAVYTPVLDDAPCNPWPTSQLPEDSYSAQRLIPHLHAAAVLCSALHLRLATEQRIHGHALAATAAIALPPLFAFQQGVLTQLALSLRFLLGVNAEVAAFVGACDPAKISDIDTLLFPARADNKRSVRHHTMRLAVDAFVGAYYLPCRADSHFIAAAADSRALLCSNVSHKLCLNSTTAAAAAAPWLDTHVPRRSGRGGREGDFDGGMENPRLRCMFPLLNATLGALAELLNPALQVQPPHVARQTLWLARIIYHELPPLRASVMRVLSMIDCRALSASDATGLASLCAAYLVDHAPASRAFAETAALARQLCPRSAAAPASSLDSGSDSVATQIVLDLSSLAWREWLTALSPCFGVNSDAEHPSDMYFSLYPETQPAVQQQLAHVYARYALDRYVAGWVSSDELYACVDAPGASTQPGPWIVDRSGPRGAAQPPTPAHGLDADPADLSIASTAPIASPGIRPPSPFPDSIIDIDVAPSVLAGASAAQPSLIAEPGIHFHNQAPLFPGFVVLADGRTIWNSSWKFESVRMRTGIDGRLGGVHRFYVRLLTSGLMQIGWCSNLCGFHPESGEGVGDDYESVAYDGFRERKWYGTSEEKRYGERWEAGDIIAAELDLDNDRVSFYRNSNPLGLAFGINEHGSIEGVESGFQGLSRDRTWYPAFSFASEQGLVFLGAEDPIHNIPRSSSSPVENILIEVLETHSLRQPAANHGKNVELSTTSVEDLRDLGIVKAYRLRFEFQDLDTMPCFALTLPAGMGRITVGPLTDPATLSTYLQPQWWAVWTDAGPDKGCAGRIESLALRYTPASEMREWFARAAAGDADVRQRNVLTSVVPSSSWIYIVVLADGRLCIASVCDNMPLGSATPVVFDIGPEAASAYVGPNGHMWLPTASPAMISFELQPICV
ncbi:hypothetical protein COEREDRAFT_87104 [Coemansia reversa NRRL 1564]|uniref:B30.2/SPRY domain-containing protein n=1 Tax=Coemansia reversa (strain ATCC 12441 / NRRL 1564) TaxID=763665 RepID=A0A2G5BBM2_COERN|nr:hypothetical protein COEREDRAFT_87104 [Coemansia reversa NRRL 1564]|eukprot:PIA16405.1 hypothetical protein COEREDRAFT_87104 [Coemansia reversa NRRL 1564]